LVLGRIDEALDAAGEAAHITERQPSYLLFPPAPFVVEALARGREHARCEALCAKADEIGRTAGSPPGLLVALFGRGASALEQGRHDDAVHLLEDAVPLAKDRGPVMHARLLRAAAEARGRRAAPGDAAQAHTHLTEALALLEGMGDVRGAEQARRELETARAGAS